MDRLKLGASRCKLGAPHPGLAPDLAALRRGDASSEQDTARLRRIVGDVNRLAPSLSGPITDLTPVVADLERVVPGLKRDAPGLLRGEGSLLGDLPGSVAPPQARCGARQARDRSFQG